MKLIYCQLSYSNCRLFSGNLRMQTVSIKIRGMEDYIKQERQKLRTASDNIKQMLQVIENRDKKHFFWAWMQLESNLQAVKECFNGSSKEFKDKIDKLFNHHGNTLERVKQVHKKLMKNPKIEALTDEELKHIIKGVNYLLDDLHESF